MTDIIEPVVNVEPNVSSNVSKRGRKKKIINPITTETNAQAPITIQEKVYLTDTYTRNAIDRYREKNIDKAREYNKLYNQKRKEDKIKENPFYGLTKKEIYYKLNEMHAKIIDLETKLSKYENIDNNSNK